MNSAQQALTRYLIGASVVWVCIFFAVALMLPEHFAQLLPILAGGAVWFVVLVPPLFHGRDGQCTSAGKGGHLA